MTLTDQAARRVELARAIGVPPLRWIVTSDAEAVLRADAAREAWDVDRVLLRGLPMERGQPRSEWELDLVLAPRVK